MLASALRHCSFGGIGSGALLAILAAASPAAGQATGPAAPVTGDAVFRIFLRGAAIGSAQSSVNQVDEGWQIRGSSQLGAPLDVSVARLEITYNEAWLPISATMDLSTRDEKVTVRSGFGPGAPASIDITRNGEAVQSTAQVAADSLILPNLAFSAYEALAIRLSTAEPGTELKAYILPQAEITIRLDSVRDETIQTTDRAIETRRWRVVFSNPNGDLPVDVWIENGRLARFDVPSQSLSVARDDIAAVGSRIALVSRANDELVFLEARGFNLAATISKPEGATGELPAVILVGGSGQTDRDETVAGIPVFGHLAGALADAGYLVVRYDKRGVGQSGGRLEAATLTDFAEDVRSIIRELRRRDDVDDDRIAIFGHSEGAWVGLLTADRERRVKALVLAGASAAKGAELVLEQQRLMLSQSDMSEAERQKAIELQKQILSAVVTGSGWDGVPAELRRQADTPEYRSLLLFDPLELLRDVDVPILVVHGELDRQVPIHHADELAALAKGRPRGQGADLVKFPSLNHLFVPAETGEVAEYNSLTDRNVSPQLGLVVSDWLQKNLPER